LINLVVLYVKKIGIFWLYYTVLKRVDLLCCISQPLYNFLIEKRYSENHLHILSNVKFLDKPVERLIRESLPTKNTRRVLYSGRINLTRDDFYTLFEAWRLLLDQGTNLQLDIFGSGPKQEIQKVSKLIKEFNLEDSVTFHGFVSRALLEQALERADAFLLLKSDIPQNRFNYPTKLMDYLSYGKPVIMSKIASHERHFSHGKNSLMVTPGSTSELFDVLKTIATSYETVTPIGIEGSKLLRIHFDATVESAKLVEKLYKYNILRKPQ